MKRFLRILGVLGLLLVAGIITLYTLGGRPELYQAEIGVKAPPEVVFPYLVEPRHLTNWVNGLLEVRQITESGRSVGSKWKVVLKLSDDSLELEDELVDITENNLLRIRRDTKACLTTNTFALRIDGDGTHLHQTLSAHYNGFVRILAPLLKTAAETQMGGDLKRLKQLVEANDESITSDE